MNDVASRSVCVLCGIGDQVPSHKIVKALGLLHPLEDGDVANAVFAALNAPPSKEIAFDSGHEVVLSRVIMPDNAEQISAVMRELIEEFSKRWKKAGGLQQFLKPKTKASAE